MLPLPITYALVALAAVLMAAAASVPLARMLARVWNAGANRHARWVFLAAVGLAVAFAGAKHGSVTYPYTDPEVRYLVDAGSYVTNDYVHVAFTLSPLVPDTADLQGYVRPADSTNDADWVQMLDTTFGAFTSPSNVPYAGAVSNDFQFFTTWTPGPTVHTNGVALINWRQGPSTNLLATIRTGIYLDARRLAPNPAITNGPKIVIQATLTAPSQGDETDE